MAGIRLVCKRCPFEFSTTRVSAPDVERFRKHLATDHPEALRITYASGVAMVMRNTHLHDKTG